MATRYSEAELEALPELAHESAHELGHHELAQELGAHEFGHHELGHHELAHEFGHHEFGHHELGAHEASHEAEADRFFGGLAKLARRAVSSPALRRIALSAGRAALQGGLGKAGPAALRAAMAALRESAHEGEFEDELDREDEWEGEGEFEDELNPIRRVYADALMEHLGHAAAEAATEAEAEAYVGAMIPLAARAAPAMMAATPGLIGGARKVAQVLRASPDTRSLTLAMPEIVRRTARAINRQQAATGRPVSQAGAVQALARQTQQVLSSPQRAVRAYRRSVTLDRRFHRGVTININIDGRRRRRM